jgi:hypothetical protein
MPVINGVYLKDFAALPSAVVDANIIPIAISGNQIAYRTTVGGIVTDARVTSKLLTGLSVTGGAVVATDTILQAFGKVQNQINSKVSSVGLTMPAAFSVANSPITSAGTLAVTAIGAASQYIRGDGALADFPTSGGGGSSVSYYLNGSVSQGTIGGNAYYEMNKTPVIGTGTDFTINANGYIAQFITDANDPASLLIPAGNWNVEMYFSASSNGGTPSFYVEVYKYNGTTFTLLGSSATTPEGITNGTAIDIYYTSVGIPETVLAITDRLAIRVYVTHSGRTITLHTEDNHLSEIVTTFSNGLTALNGLTKQAQYFAVGSTGTDFNISSSVDTHTFNIPSASASNRGLITTGAQTIAGTKSFTSRLNVNQAADIGVSTRATGAGGIGLYAEATVGNGAWIYNSGTGSEVLKVEVGNLTGALATFSNTNGSVATISNAGNITANSFIKTGGTSSQFLKADGSVDTTTYQGAITLGAIGISPNANAASLVGSILNLQPADASFGGVVTTGTQTFAGAKTFTGALSGTSITLSGDYNSTSNSGSLLWSGATNKVQLNANAGTLDFYTGTSGYTKQLSIASTGAATFSSSLSVGAALTGRLSVRGTTSDATAYALEAGNSSGNTLFAIRNDGAATFSSTIQSGGDISLMNASGDISVRMKDSGGNADRVLLRQATTNNVYVGDIDANGGQLIMRANGNDAINITSGGNVQIGGTTNNNGNISINSTNPVICFGTSSSGPDVALVGTAGGANYHITGSAIGDFCVRPIATGNLLFGTSASAGAASSERMRITSGGQVLVGKTTNSTRLSGATVEAEGTFYSGGSQAGYFFEDRSNATYWYGWYSAANTNVFFYNGNAGANIASINPSTGAYTALSDINKKKDFESSTIGLNEVLGLKPTLYRMKSDESDNQKELGFIAQEVKEFIPQAYVESGKDEDKFIGLNYNAIVAALVKSVQELKAEIDLLKGEPIAPEVTHEPEPTDNNLE